MNTESRKMLRRSIKDTLGRFLAILAITALGVGFYAGLKTSQPDMLRAADDYLHRQRMFDFQLLSSLGLTGSDTEAFRQLPGVSAAEGACFADAWARIGDRNEEVWHFQTLTEQVAVPELLSGRMPENEGECLGDSLAFSEDDLGRVLLLTGSNDADTLAHFSCTEFTLVGLVRSPRYISFDRGSSELGSGKPAGFVLLPDEAFADEVYHELLLWCDLPGDIYSEDYTDALRHMKPAVETLLNRRGVLRQEALRKELGEELERGRKELAEGWSEYRLGKRRAEKELQDAERQLNAAQTQWNAGQESFSKREKELADQEQQLTKKRAALSQESAALAAEQAALSTERSAATQEQTSILLERTGLETRKTIELSGIATQLASVYVQILAAQAIPGTDVSALEQERDSLQNQLDRAQERLENPNPENGDPTWYADGIHSLDERETANDAVLEALDDREKALNERSTALESAQMELEMTESLLPESRRLLEDSRQKLIDGWAELSEGWTKYYNGKEKAEKELAEALRKLEDAEKELAAGEAELEEGLQLDLFTLDRTSNPGYVTFENDSAIVDGIAVVFPFFFVLVAALVCVTTMTRMVSEERTQIGTLKAMGFSSPAIMAKYLLYASLSALIGCVLGFFLGCTGLPYIVWYAYNIIYQYEDLLYSFSSWMFAACLFVSVAGSLLVTWFACRKALLERPAELIRPKAPAVGKRVLLERIPFLWKRLPFLSKVSIRNAFRYPSRVLMMLLGIGGCTALMVAGFGAKDSLSGVGSFQYDEISLYDIVVTLDPSKAGPHPETLWNGWAAAAEITHREEIRLKNADGDGKDTTLIFSASGTVERLISLHDKNRAAIAWPGPGEAVITKILSEALNLRIGDSAILRLENGKERMLTVSGICEYYVGHAVFAAPDGFPDTDGNYALIRVRDGEDIARRAAALRSAKGISYVSLTQTERETLENSMQSIDLLVLMLVFCSGALAFITLYNLTNINILERIREVATVKVLGFTPRETGQYILNENLMLSILGAGLGLVLGKLLHRFVMEMLKLDYMSYDIRIAKISYLLSFVITFVFALLTNLVMRRKLEKVNMAESLKSVE